MALCACRLVPWVAANSDDRYFVLLMSGMSFESAVAALIGDVGDWFRL